MGIVRINIHKVNAEKNPTARVGQVKINNTVAITNIEPLNMKLAGKAGCKFTFTFGSKFEPALGAIDIEGSILFTGEEDVVNEIVTAWKNDQKVADVVKQGVVNAALHKGHIEAIKMSDDLGLPSPLPFKIK